MKYFEFKQIPNFILPSPLIYISIQGILSYIHQDPLRYLTLNYTANTSQKGYTSSKTLAYVYLWTILLFICTTSMHVQIMPRFFSSLPCLYWFVAHVLVQYRRDHGIKHVHWIVWYFVIYASVGTVLFINFLPPA